MLLLCCDEPILSTCRVAQKDAPMNHRFNDMPTRNRHRIHVYPLLGLFWIAVTTVRPHLHARDVEVDRAADEDPHAKDR